MSFLTNELSKLMVEGVSAHKMRLVPLMLLTIVIYDYAIALAITTPRNWGDRSLTLNTLVFSNYKSVLVGPEIFFYYSTILLCNVVAFTNF